FEPPEGSSHLSSDFGIYRSLANSREIFFKMSKRQKLAPIFETLSKKKKEDSDNVYTEPDTSPRERTIVAWNVAGVRAWIKKGGHTLVADLNADIVFLGETKCEEIPPELRNVLKGYHSTLVPSIAKKGYAGVALFSKERPMKVFKGTGDKDFDDAGRLIVAEYPSFFFLGAYVLNSGSGLVNLEKRGKWEEVMREKLKSLDEKKPVIYGGDLNVAHNEIDLANPKSNANKTPGFTDQEREDMTKMLDCGFADSFRSLHGNRVAYTFWSYMNGARNRNIGWRLDYFITSKRIVDNIISSDMVDDDKKTSDHCPILLTLTI
ncbi:hypothetical protein PFISCL1PPCAC_19802, partial [Pristionchus fissidentatus]